MMAGLQGVELLATLGAVLVIGALIGSVGVGGLLLTPWLVRIAGLGVREAITVSMASFIATGLVALLLFIRDDISVRNRWPLIAATMPGALLGALALAAAPEVFAAVLLAGVLMATGLRLLFARQAGAGAGTRPSWKLDAPVGALAGFASALTGTGGPMVLVPVLVWRGTPLMTAIALGQIVQLPVAAVATVGNYASGGVNLAMGAFIGVVLVPGVLIGRRLAEAMPLATVTRIVAVVLVAAGVWLAICAI